MSSDDLIRECLPVRDLRNSALLMCLARDWSCAGVAHVESEPVVSIVPPSLHEQTIVPPSLHEQKSR
eukprot:scaffold6019_cov162-Pinguiococcus_pyrenoidosus.AAC.1